MSHDTTIGKFSQLSKQRGLVFARAGPQSGTGWGLLIELAIYVILYFIFAAVRDRTKGRNRDRGVGDTDEL